MSDVAIRVEGRTGRITLTRPQALNALSYEMALPPIPGECYCYMFAEEATNSIHGKKRCIRKRLACM
jgi:hypothetical protein